MTRRQAARYGLAQLALHCRQTAVNLVLGQDSRSRRPYLDSMPLIMESAFEYTGPDPVRAAAASFQAFSRARAELFSHYIYQRLNGPNDTALALTLAGIYASLSDRGSLEATVTNNGMSAFRTLMGTLRPGETIIWHPIAYGCTKSVITSYLAERKIRSIPDRFNNLAALKQKLIRIKSARMIMTETELNPTLEIPDLAGIAQVVAEVNAFRTAKGWNSVIFWVDNTFPSFANLVPFNFGIDVVADSLTKFVCGTGENMGGVVVIDTNKDYGFGGKDYGSLFGAVMMRQKDDGLSMSPFPAWDILRHLPSIAMRRTQVQATAQKIAEYLINHPAVAKLHYPGMVQGDDLQNERAHFYLRDERGNFAPGYIIYLVLKGQGNAAKKNARKLLNWLSRNTQIKVKVSFGQQDTLVETPASMTHSAYSPEELSAVDIDEGGIRLAIGWAEADYIIACLREGLRHVFGARYDYVAEPSSVIAVPPVDVTAV